jgi:hypothetical protein
MLSYRWGIRPALLDGSMLWRFAIMTEGGVRRKSLDLLELLRRGIRESLDRG